MIGDCLYKIEKETTKTREYYAAVQGLMLYRFKELAVQGYSTK